MDFFQAFILGVIEGVTEFLPISSTGHLILASKLLGIKGEFAKTFEIAIQLGAIFSVAVLYARLLLNSFETWKRIIVAFIPTGVIGLAFYKIVKKYLLGNEMVVVWALLIGGILIILF
ncbi:MAG: undecaprenyl-diphosphate phosphatase, partial [Patescibacteria group bacterium]